MDYKVMTMSEMMLVPGKHNTYCNSSMNKNECKKIAKNKGFRYFLHNGYIFESDSGEKIDDEVEKSMVLLTGEFSFNISDINVENMTTPQSMSGMGPIDTPQPGSTPGVPGAMGSVDIPGGLVKTNVKEPDWFKKRKGKKKKRKKPNFLKKDKS